MEALNEPYVLSLLPGDEVRAFIRMTLQVDELISIIMETFNTNLSIFYTSPFARLRCEKAAIWVVGYKQAVAKRVVRLQQRKSEMIAFINSLDIEDQSRFWNFCNENQNESIEIVDILELMYGQMEWVEVYDYKPLLAVNELNTIFSDMIKELELE